MILPTKKLKPENSIVYLGAVVLGLLDEPKTVSRVWDEFSGFSFFGRQNHGFISSGSLKMSHSSNKYASTAKQAVSFFESG